MIDIGETIEILQREFLKAKETKFTGQVTISINMTQGGFGQVSLQTTQNISNFKKNNC